MSEAYSDSLYHSCLRESPSMLKAKSGKTWSTVLLNFSHLSTKTHVVGTQKNRLLKTILLSTSNIGFC